jgi:putative transposase
LREAGLTLPIDYVRERRDLAGARREAFVELPTRRNRVWQMDFFELETSGGGTWRSGDVIDYATKLVLAGPVTATQTTRDAIDSVITAIAAAEQLLGGPLLDDLTDPQTAEITPIFLVTDNGPCFKSHGFARYIDARPELRHIRTRRRSPQTNGVIERYHGAIKIEALWRDLPADGAQMTTIVKAFRQLYNTIRPHETLHGDRPIERYLADPNDTPTAPAPTRQRVGFLDAGQRSHRLKRLPRPLLKQPPQIHATVEDLYRPVHRLRKHVDPERLKTLRHRDRPIDIGLRHNGHDPPRAT